VNDADLIDLEQQLSDLSLTEAALKHVEDYCGRLKDTRERLRVWNQVNAIVRAPIDIQETTALGFDQPDDQFILLQGDVVRTESAYFMGARNTGRAKYAVLNSSCDLISGRRSYSSLLRILEINDKQTMGELLKFRRRDCMYMPRLPDDPSNLLGNAINFDGISQIETSHLLLANRVASLSLVGWRIFASFSRVVIARANPREVEMRTAIEKAPITKSARGSPPT
jgi:hypothetical protein